MKCDIRFNDFKNYGCMEWLELEETLVNWSSAHIAIPLADVDNIKLERYSTGSDMFLACEMLYKGWYDGFGGTKALPFTHGNGNSDITLYLSRIETILDKLLEEKGVEGLKTYNVVLGYVKVLVKPDGTLYSAAEDIEEVKDSFYCPQIAISNSEDHDEVYHILSAILDPEGKPVYRVADEDGKYRW